MVRPNTKSVRLGGLADNPSTGGRDRVSPRVTTPRPAPQKDFKMGQRLGEIAASLVDPDGDIHNVRDEYNEIWDKCDRDKQNLIHHIIMELKRIRRSDAKFDLSSGALDVIEELVYKMPELFVAQDLNEQPKIPILEAAKVQFSVLFRVVELLIPVEDLELMKRFSCEGSDAECPLRKLPRVCLKICALKSTSSTHSETKDSTNGDSQPFEESNMPRCLHQSVDMEKLEKKNNELRKTLREALAKEPEHPQVPCLHSLMAEANFDKEREQRGSFIPVDGFKTLLELCPDRVLNSATGKQGTPLQMAVQLFTSEGINYERLSSVIEALVERSPSSVFFGAEQSVAAYRKLKDMEKDIEQRSRDPDQKSYRRSAEELLKEVCIASDRTRSEKKAFLYWNPKDERKFYLNLTGESSVLDKAYVQTMKEKSGMEFETILDCVALPYWNQPSHSPNHGRQPSDPVEDVNSRAETEPGPYRAVFDWLWESNIQKILSVDVDDSGSEPHTNAAIRKAFRGEKAGTDWARDFQVEVWKWKKYDLCSDTIAVSAPSVREVYLFSHGNTAVLKGWASKGGLAKLKQLRKLVVQISPKNVEDEHDCTEYKPGFIRKLLRRCPNLTEENIIVDVEPRHTATQTGENQDAANGATLGGNIENQEKMLSANQWIEQLAGFREFLLNLRNVPELRVKPSVKVALLDDGVRLDVLKNKPRGLQSFHSDGHEYFVGSCSHGTAMARCIQEVCPMVELYIARLDTSRRDENQTFTTASCYQALKWALDMNVDVVSMSLSIKKMGEPGSDEYRDKFADLVRIATSKHRAIIFASLPDETGVNIDDYLPVGLEGVIKIGSGTIYGEGSSVNKFSNPHFLLPGNDITENSGEDKGSSYATAYASGLAAIVFYSLRAYQELSKEDEEDEADENERAATLRAASTLEGMKRIFTHLAQKTIHDKDERGLFVRPYQTFVYKYGDSIFEKRKALKRIVERMRVGPLPP